MFKFIKRKRARKQLDNLTLEMSYVKKAINVYENIVNNAEQCGTDVNLYKDTISRLADLELKLMKLELNETILLRKIY